MSSEMRRPKINHMRMQIRGRAQNFTPTGLQLVSRISLLRGPLLIGTLHFHIGPSPLQIYRGGGEGAGRWM